MEAVPVPWPLEPLPLPAAELLGRSGPEPVLGLHCGSGTNLAAGWLNSDSMMLRDPAGRSTRPGEICLLGGRYLYLQHDASQPFPLPAASLAWVYSEHFIEHLPWPDGIRWLAEMRRLLRPGGSIRVSTPDLEAYVRGYLDPEQRLFHAQRDYLLAHGSKNVPERRSFMLNQIFFYWGHRWIYDFAELCHALGQAGFASARRCGFRSGGNAQVAALDQEMRRQESLYVEASRD